MTKLEELKAAAYAAGAAWDAANGDACSVVYAAYGAAWDAYYAELEKQKESADD